MKLYTLKVTKKELALMINAVSDFVDADPDRTDENNPDSKISFSLTDKIENLWSKTLKVK
jgi:hypothetical protein